VLLFFSHAAYFTTLSEFAVDVMLFLRKRFGFIREIRAIDFGWQLNIRLESK